MILWTVLGKIQTLTFFFLPCLLILQAPTKISLAGGITDHFGAILLIARRLHLHEHVLDAVNVRSVLPAPPRRAGQRGGLRGGVRASVGCVAQVVGGLLKPGQPRLVGVAVGRGTPQVGVAASATAAARGPIAPCGWRGLGLHHVWIIRCPLLSSELAGRRTASSWSCSISTPWNAHRGRNVLPLNYDNGRDYLASIRNIHSITIWRCFKSLRKQSVTT